MARVIPGVEVKVVKEIIPPPAYPSGTVALIGTAEKGPELTPVHLGSWREFADTFGAGTDFTLTLNAKQCFQNGVFEVVATRIVGKGGDYAKASLKDEEKGVAVVIEALCQGCGACAATCPNSAAKIRGFTDRQVLSIVDAAL